jgi:hypothetical protein
MTAPPGQCDGRRVDQDHHPLGGRVHPPLPAACPARRLPPHPPLRPVRQRPTGRQHRPDPEPARNAAPLSGRAPTRPRRATDACLPLLRRTPHNRRALPPGRVCAGTSERRCQDRHLMIVAPHATATTDRCLTGPPTRHEPARAIKPDPTSSTRHGTSNGQHPHAAAPVLGARQRVCRAFRLPLRPPPTSQAPRKIPIGHVSVATA